MTYNFTTLTIKNANEDQIKNAKYIKRNLKIIDKGDFKILEKYSKKELSVKFNFSRDDTIFKNYDASKDDSDSINIICVYMQ